jgi:hypothetical protein
MGATGLTGLLGPGGQFTLDDIVRAGGARLPPAGALVGNPVVVRGKGRPKETRLKSASETKKRKHGSR